ncbi:MAG TPA: hypothetical protein VFP78_06090 [Solirubrobacteraceae bacterium]|nr:hypothetical protein [Solirubrobacteraceae bacterium]
MSAPPVQTFTIEKAGGKTKFDARCLSISGRERFASASRLVVLAPGWVPPIQESLGKEIEMGTARANRYASTALARASLARAVILVATAVALILVAGIALVALEANRSNEIVQVVRDAAAFLAGPFDSLFTLDSNKAEKAVNWGIAAGVWYALGRLIARLLLRR